MKRFIFKYILPALTALVLTSVVGCDKPINSTTNENDMTNSNTPTTGIKTYSELDTLIYTKVGDKFTIELRSDRQSEGFAWSVAEIKPGIAKVVDFTLGDIDTFTFLTLTKGQTKITLLYSIVDEGGIYEVTSLIYTVNIN